jgi:antitoxin component YwqK of YwqJK toxin-antitoxin module
MKQYFIILFVFLLNSCGTRTKEKVNFYKTGEIESKEILVNEKNVYTSYYKNGKIKSRSFSEKGILNGPTFLYYENGALMVATNYKNGSNQGKTIYYYNNGNKRSEGILKNGKEIGIWKYYYPDGKLKETKDKSVVDRPPIILNE